MSLDFCFELMRREAEVCVLSVGVVNIPLEVVSGASERPYKVLCCLRTVHAAVLFARQLRCYFVFIFFFFSSSLFHSSFPSFLLL